MEQLEKLRLKNQDLLQRLKANQKAFRKGLPGKTLPTPLQSKRGTPKNRQGLVPQIGKESRGQAVEELTSSVMRAFGEAGPHVARPGHEPSSKPTTSHKEEEEEEKVHRTSLHPGPRGSDEGEMAGESARAAGRTVQVPSRGMERKSIPASQAEAERPRAGAGSTQVPASHGPRASARMPQIPKPILLTPQCKEAKEKSRKEAGRVTFLSDPEEYSPPADEWSVRPFLGYDWIAGLLDMDSSVSEKPEQYFSELQNFRRVNKDACIYDGCLRSEALGSSVLEQDSETDSTSHQCVFCYRLNKRLFAVPVGSESACPLCKTRRSWQPPGTLLEPAFVRVSIPRSTLLPAYKHRIHCRKSYEPADDLALPSHCLAGWENSVQAFSLTLSSLDLQGALAAKPSGRSDWNSVSRVSGGTRTDNLLNLSHLTAFELSNVSRLQRHQKLPSQAVASR